MVHSTRQHPCDQCYQRRVRCRALPNEPCNACTIAHLKCTRERTRGKRGPKKSATKSKSAHGRDRNDAWRSTEESNTTLSTRVDEGDDEIHSDPLPIESGHVSNLQQLTIDNNPGSYGLPSYGRGRVQLAENRKAATVNQLADFILDGHGLNEKHSYSDWLWGLRYANSPDQQNQLTNNSIHLTPGPSLQEVESREPIALALNARRGHNPDPQSPQISVPRHHEEIDGTALAIATGLSTKYGPEMIRCIEIYFNCFYHVIPIVHEKSFRRLLARPSQLSLTQRAFVLAFCAATELQNLHMLGEELKSKAKEYGCIFLEQFLRLRYDIDYVEESTSSMVVIAFLASKAYACLNKHKSAMHYLREAICKSMELGLHRTDELPDFQDAEDVCAQRAVALLFVTERATAILDNSNILLFREPPTLPDSWFDEADRKALAGFQCLFDLLKLIDSETVEVWCSDSFASWPVTNSMREKIAVVQKHLSDASYFGIGLNDNQRADVQVTQHWLRLIFWQVSMRLGLLSQWSDDPAFSYDYPVKLGKALCEVLRTLPESSLYVHYYSIVSQLKLAFQVVEPDST